MPALPASAGVAAPGKGVALITGFGSRWNGFNREKKPRLGGFAGGAASTTGSDAAAGAGGATLAGGSAVSVGGSAVAMTGSGGSLTTSTFAVAGAGAGW